MTTEQKYIRIGYFDNFDGEDSILISVDIEGLLEIEEVFSRLENGLSTFEFSNLKLLDKEFRIKLTAFIDNENMGLRETSLETYEWRATREKWSEFREMLTTMYRNGNGGHHYLDSDPNDNKDLQVVFSLGEYPLEFWRKHKKLNKNAL